MVGASQTTALAYHPAKGHLLVPDAYVDLQYNLIAEQKDSTYRVHPCS